MPKFGPKDEGIINETTTSGGLDPGTIRTLQRRHQVRIIQCKENVQTSIWRKETEPVYRFQE